MAVARIMIRAAGVYYMRLSRLLQRESAAQCEVQANAADSPDSKTSMEEQPTSKNSSDSSSNRTSAILVDCRRTQRLTTTSTFPQGWFFVPPKAAAEGISIPQAVHRTGHWHVMVG